MKNKKLLKKLENARIILKKVKKIDRNVFHADSIISESSYKLYNENIITELGFKINELSQKQIVILLLYSFGYIDRNFCLKYLYISRLGAIICSINKRLSIKLNAGFNEIIKIKFSNKSKGNSNGNFYYSVSKQTSKSDIKKKGVNKINLIIFNELKSQF